MSKPANDFVAQEETLGGAQLRLQGFQELVLRPASIMLLIPRSVARVPTRGKKLDASGVMADFLALALISIALVNK